MKSTLALIPALLIGIAAAPASAGETHVKCRITGLFGPTASTTSAARARRSVMSKGTPRPR